MRKLALTSLIGALLVAGCVQSETTAAPETPTPTPPLASPSPSPTPAPSVTPAASASPDFGLGRPADESAYLLALLVAQGELGAEFGDLSEDRQVELGRITCGRIDDGADFRLASAMLALDDLPAEANDKAMWAITIAAAQSLCPEHYEMIRSGAQGG